MSTTVSTARHAAPRTVRVRVRELAASLGLAASAGGKRATR